MAHQPLPVNGHSPMSRGVERTSAMCSGSVPSPTALVNGSTRSRNKACLPLLCRYSVGSDEMPQQFKKLKDWTEEEIARLTRLGRNATATEIARSLGRHIGSVKRMAKKLSLPLIKQKK